MLDIAVLDRSTGAPAGIPNAPSDAQAEATADRLLVEALRRGDEVAFEALINRYHPSAVRIAALYLSSRDLAEEVARETWLGVLRGLDRFEARSSLKTWIFRLLINRARTRGERERRMVSSSALGLIDDSADEPAVDPASFLSLDHREHPGRWASPPRSWGELPPERLLSRETCARIREVVERLPLQQREVITLRDIEGWTAEEVCALLGISDENQRVLLHRARSKIRRALEDYFDEDTDAADHRHRAAGGDGWRA